MLFLQSSNTTILQFPFNKQHFNSFAIDYDMCCSFKVPTPQFFSFPLITIISTRLPLIMRCFRPSKVSTKPFFSFPLIAVISTHFPSIMICVVLQGSNTTILQFPVHNHYFHSLAIDSDICSFFKVSLSLVQK